MLGRILAEARVRPAELVDTLPLEEIDTKPRPCLTLRTPRQNWGPRLGPAPRRARVRLRRRRDPGRADHPAGRLDRARPGRSAATPRPRPQADIFLFELGFRESKDPRVDPGTMELPAKRLAQVTRDLVQAGWRVEAEGKLIRPAGEFKLAVTTGIDWFELGGQVDFGGQERRPARPARRRPAGRDDGRRSATARWACSPRTGSRSTACSSTSAPRRTATSGSAAPRPACSTRSWRRSPRSRSTPASSKVREALHQFEGVKPLEAPRRLPRRAAALPVRGPRLARLPPEVRLRRHPGRRHGPGQDRPGPRPAPAAGGSRRQAKGPSLVVVPRSLVFNWIAGGRAVHPEAPRARLHRPEPPRPPRDSSTDYDLIITTYGTLRTDIVELSQIEFDYVILDEAQAIKNADSQAAKAARLLRGRHRLAMSGTPIENHLGELWSIFEFLNPGMLGTGSVFKQHTTGAGAARRRGPRAPGHARCGRSSSAGPRRRSSRTCPRRSSRPSTATWSRPSGSSTRSSGPTTARPSCARTPPS